MGCTYDAHTVLGLRIRYADLEAAFVKANTRTTRGCDHDVPEDSKFCSQCGAERIVTIVPKFYFGNWQEEIQERNPGLTAVADSNEFPTFIYLGFGNESGENDAGSKFEIPTADQIEALKDSFRKAFIPMGLWDTRNFGVWTFLYVGC